MTLGTQIVVGSVRSRLRVGPWAALLLGAGVAACSSSGADSGGAGGSTAGQGGGVSGSSAHSGYTSGGSGVGGSLNLGGTGQGGVASPGGAGGSAGALGGAANGGSSGAANQACPFGDQLVHDTSYGIATTLRLCFVSISDNDLRYTMTTPATPAGGGYVVVSFRNVSSRVEIGVSISPAVTNFAIDSQMWASANGADYDTWFAAMPGADFFVDVRNESGGSLRPLNDFDMSATFVPVDDTYESNDYQANAHPISLGTPVKAYSFSGYGKGPNEFLNGWYDFYKVTLTAGTPTLKLSGVPQAFPLEVRLDSQSAADNYPSFYATTLGIDSATVTPPAPISAGDYLVVITPTTTPHPYGKGTVPDAYATQQYTLTVTE